MSGLSLAAERTNEWVDQGIVNYPYYNFDENLDILANKGNEFGTVTGRPRRCGWFDSVLVKQVSEISGVQGLALTKLDVLDGLDEIKVCVKYKINNDLIDYFPSSISDQKKLEPVYESLEGWKGSVHGVRSWDDLPAGAQKYVRFIEENTGVRVDILTTSPEREDTILIKNPFEKI